jgi:hypothetical protein
MMTLDPPGEGTMRQFFLSVAAAALLTGGATRVDAHFNMLLPDKASVRKDEPVILTYQWGHPFEHQLFDAPSAEKLTVIAPDGASKS